MCKRERSVFRHGELRLQPIFGSLPSYANPDFIAMSQWLNGDAQCWVSEHIFGTLQIATATVYFIFSGQLPTLNWAEPRQQSKTIGQLATSDQQGHKEIEIRTDFGWGDSYH